MDRWTDQPTKRLTQRLVVSIKGGSRRAEKASQKQGRSNAGARTGQGQEKGERRAGAG